MLDLTLIVLAVLAGLLGFGGIFDASSPSAWIFGVLVFSTVVVALAQTVRGDSRG